MRGCVMIVAMVLCGVGGCASLQQALEGMDKPTARITGVRFDSLALDRAGMLFDVEVSNPYAVALPLVNIDYGLASGGAAFMSGQAAMEGSIPAKGTRTVTLPVNVAFSELLSAVSGVRPGHVVPYQADMKLSVDAPGVGPLALPMSRQGEVPVPAVPAISLESVAFESLTFTEAAAVLKIDIENTNQFPVDLTKLGYALALGGTSITSSEVARPASFAAGQKRRIEIPIRFQPANLGPAVFNMLRGNGASFDLSGDFELGTRFGKLALPYRKTGQTLFER